MTNKKSPTSLIENFKPKVLEIVNEFVKTKYKEMSLGISTISGPQFYDFPISSVGSYLKVSIGSKYVSFFELHYQEYASFFISEAFSKVNLSIFEYTNFLPKSETALLYFLKKEAQKHFSI